MVPRNVYPEAINFLEYTGGLAVVSSSVFGKPGGLAYYLPWMGEIYFISLPVSMQLGLGIFAVHGSCIMHFSHVIKRKIVTLVL